MSGKFRCFAVTELFYIKEDPGQDHIPKWKRRWESFVKNKTLEGFTGVVIFGPNQEDFLKIFLNSNVYKILFQSKKCVNPNYRSSPGRNTIVIFEEK